jgi:hypothetical protein
MNVMVRLGQASCARAIPGASAIPSATIAKCFIASSFELGTVKQFLCRLPKFMRFQWLARGLQ